jgi:hypothetical protein
MSWIDEIKLARWLNNGVAMVQTFGINLIGSGATAVDNPTYSTTLPDGTVVTGRTEIAFPPPNQPMVWSVPAAPAVAAERFISNYGLFFATQHGKIAARRFKLNSIRWQSKGITPAQSMLLQLYHNGATVPGWSMTIPALAGPNYKQELRPSTPFITSNGCVLCISLTQAGVGASATMNGVIALT